MPNFSIRGILNLSVFSLLCAPAHAQSPPPNYLAFGDSVAFGLNPTLLPPFAPLDLNNFKGYPVFVADQLNLKLANASRVAETSTSFLTGMESDRLPYPLWNPWYPNFVTYSPTQLSQADYAVDELSKGKTRLVTLNIAGNDLGVLQIRCGTNVLCTATGLPLTIAAASRNVNTILKRVRREAGYNGPLVVLTYYAFNYTDAQAVSAFVSLNTALATVTTLYGGKVADGFGAFLKASLPYGGDACAAGLLVPLGNGTCDTHPSPLGQKLLADAVLAALKK